MKLSNIIVLSTVASCFSAALITAGCSSSSSGGATGPGGSSSGSSSGSASSSGNASSSGGASSSGSSSGAIVTGLAIQAKSGSLQAAPGDALQLEVVQTLAGGGTEALPSGAQVTWTSPSTVVALNPDDPDAGSSIPATGAQPTGFFVSNTFRVIAPGALFVIDPGTGSSPQIAVTATVGDAGVSAQVNVLPTPTGDATRGAAIFKAVGCYNCHGATGAGSPHDLDAGDGGDFDLEGKLYPYPAPPLYDAPDSGDVADNPAWNAPLIGLAAQANINNKGIALREPMPSFIGEGDGMGKTLSGQDFADIYAWLLTQGH